MCCIWSGLTALHMDVSLSLTILVSRFVSHLFSCSCILSRTCLTPPLAKTKVFLTPFFLFFLSSFLHFFVLFFLPSFLPSFLAFFLSSGVRQPMEDPPCLIHRYRLTGTMHNAQCTTHKGQSTKHKAQSSKLKAQSTTHNAQRTMHSAQRCSAHNAGAHKQNAVVFFGSR